MSPAWRTWATPAVVAAAFAAALLGLGAAGFTGSSDGTAVAYDPLLDAAERAPRDEVFGRARGIRSDEWAVELPLTRAQQLGSPAFPEVNTKEFLGQPQRTAAAVPVADWGAAFRPLMWPIFAGGLRVYGVQWFLRDALLFLGLYGWCTVVTGAGRAERRRGWVALLAATALFFSSSLRWWLSSAIAPIVAFTGLCAWATSRHLAARTRPARVGWLVAAGWLAGAAFFYLYPPFWAPMLWLLCATAFDAAWRDSGGLGRAAARTAPVVLVVAAAVSLAIAYASPYLALVVGTVYPGRRVAGAGEMPLSYALSNLWPSLQVLAPLHGAEHYRGRIPGMNVCEASAVEALPAVVLGALACAGGPVRAAAARVLGRNPALVVAAAVLLAWLFVPWPPAVGVVTLLRWSIWPRLWVAAGIGCALLSAATLAELAADGQGEGWRWRDLAIASGVLLVTWLLAREQVVAVDPRLRNLSLLWAVPAALGIALLRPRVGALVVAAAWAVSLVLADVAVNPLLPATHLFRRGQGHAVVDAALERVPGRLVDYTGTPGSVLAGFGWPVLAGVAIAPDLGLTRYLAAESPGLDDFVANRYAHVYFTLPPERSRLAQDDVFNISVSPCSPRLATLGVNHFLVGAGARLPAGCEGAFEVRRAGEAVLWTRRDPVAGEGVARTSEPTSALDFDFRVAAAGRPVVRQRRDGFDLDIPGPRSVAVAVNRYAVADVRCEGADAAFLEAHLVATPRGEGGARCRVAYLGAVSGLRRLASLEVPVADRLPLVSGGDRAARARH